MGSGRLPFDAVEAVPEGPDPPDFFVDDGERRIALDCASLALSRRRHGYSLFERFRARVLEQAREQPFSAIEGCVVSTWFGDGNELPPARRDALTVDAMNAMLRASTVDREAAHGLADRMAREGMPAAIPACELPTVFCAAGGAHVSPVDPALLVSDFARETGFELALAMAPQIGPSGCSPSSSG